MSTTMHTIENFCTGCVAIAITVMAIITLATLVWIYFI
jgi:hypothetical protein